MPSSAELAEVSLSRVRWRSGEFVTAQFHEDSASERVLAVQPAQIERNITSLWAFGCNLLRSVGALKNSVAWRDSKRKLKRRSKTKKEHPKRRHRTRFGNGRCCFAKGGTLTERLDFQMEGGQQNIPERSRKIKKVGWDQRKVMG